MKKSLLIQFLGENPTFKIVDFLIENKGLEGTKIARATLFKVWPQIEEQEIVRVTRKSKKQLCFLDARCALQPKTRFTRSTSTFGKTKLYEINSKNPIIKKILELEVVLIEKAFDKRREIEIIAR